MEQKNETEDARAILIVLSCEHALSRSLLDKMDLTVDQIVLENKETIK